MDKQRKAEIALAFFSQNLGARDLIDASGSEAMRYARRVGIHFQEFLEFTREIRQEFAEEKRRVKESEKARNASKTIYITDDDRRMLEENLTSTLEPFDNECVRQILDSGKRVVFALSNPKVVKLFQEKQKQFYDSSEKETKVPPLKLGDELCIMNTSPVKLVELESQFWKTCTRGE